MSQHDPDTDETDAERPLDDVFVDGEDMDDLDAMVEVADDAREQFQASRERLAAVKERLHELVDEVDAEIEDVDDDRIEEIRGLVENGEYGRARDELRQLVQDNSLRFDDAEKQEFARAFASNWNDLRSRIEEIQQAVVELTLREGWSEDDLIDLLNGKHRINKSTTRDVFAAADSLSKMDPDDPKDAARILAAAKHDLRIEPTAEALRAIQKEAESR